MQTSRNLRTAAVELRVTVAITDAEQAVVTVTGELDAATVTELEDHLGRTLNHTPLRAVVIDLSDVTFCAVAGLRVLLTFTDDARASGVPVAIVANHRAVTRPVQILQLTQLLPLHRRLTDALDRLAALPRLVSTSSSR